jgi:very-short-patch-repair endonuclease
MPEINAPFRRFALDAVWWLQKVVVEVDGRDNHSSWAQIKRDRRKDLELRRAGFLVLRYTYDQIRFEAQQVAADIRAALAARAAA